MMGHQNLDGQTCDSMTLLVFLRTKTLRLNMTDHPIGTSRKQRDPQTRLDMARFKTCFKHTYFGPVEFSGRYEL